MAAAGVSCELEQVSPDLVCDRRRGRRPVGGNGLHAATSGCCPRALGDRALAIRCKTELCEVLARIDEGSDLPRMAETGVRERAVQGLRALGYRDVALDLGAFRSGSMNPEGS